MNVTTGLMIRKTPKAVGPLRLLYNQERQLSRSDVDGFYFKKWHCSRLRAWLRAMYRLLTGG